MIHTEFVNLHPLKCGQLRAEGTFKVKATRIRSTMANKDPYLSLKEVHVLSQKLSNNSRCDM